MNAKLSIALFVLAVPVALVLSSGCDGGGSVAPTLVTDTRTELRMGAPTTAGAEGDALAASLLLSIGTPITHDGHASFVLQDRDLAEMLEFRVRAHLEAMAFGAGGGTGTGVEGSERIRRLAKLANAPPDRNGNQSNLDETMAEDLAQTAAAAGGAMPNGMFPMLMPWRESTPDLAESNAGMGRGQLGTQRTSAMTTATPQVVDLEHVGNAMLARVLLASRLLATSRGSLAGATAEDGTTGLLLLQQALAMEETLLGALVFDGKALGRLDDPASYDPDPATPGAGWRWLPRSFTVIEGRPGVPETYLAHDQASSLAGLAAVLRGAAELAWLASDADPNPSLRDLFAGHPFGAPRPPRQGRPVQVRLLSLFGAEVTYDNDIKPILNFRCISCHSGPVPSGGYGVETYEKVLLGGIHRATHPAVVVGDRNQSLLWQVMIGPVPGVTTRMPQGCIPGLSCVPNGEVGLVGDWIDQGALRSRSEPPVAPLIGRDLAIVCLRNLKAMHMHASGALHHRHAGERGSGFVDTVATGEALLALAVATAAMPDVPLARTLLHDAAAFAAAHLAIDTGWTHDGYDVAERAGTEVITGEAQAALTAGVLAAARVLGDSSLEARGLRMASALRELFFDDPALMRTEFERASTRYTPRVVALVVEALRESAAAKVEAGHDAFLKRLAPVMVFAEWNGRGEILGDGVADTDGNGVPEPGLAGGAHGRLPLFTGEILFGPAAAAEPRSKPLPITWSEHILPLFQEKCAGCHVGGAARGEYRLDTLELARTPGESRPRFSIIVPGDPQGSLLYRKLVDRHPPIGDQMPLALPPLADRGKQLVFEWILAGAKDR